MVPSACLYCAGWGPANRSTVSCASISVPILAFRTLAALPTTAQVPRLPRLKSGRKARSSSFVMLPSLMRFWTSLLKYLMFPACWACLIQGTPPLARMRELKHTRSRMAHGRILPNLA